MPSKHFDHLLDRCHRLISKYADPAIAAENAAASAGQELPPPDIDDLLSLRLIAHAEFEYYFEEIARDYVEIQRSTINSEQTLQQSALIFLYLQKRKISPPWTDTTGKSDADAKDFEKSDFKNLLIAALGFAKDAIDKNNGIKEDNIKLLAALSGRFAGQVENTLIIDLNSFGSERGAIAHKSWKFAKKANLQSLTIERARILTLLKAVEDGFEK
jgi:hypothetical protein